MRSFEFIIDRRSAWTPARVGGGRLVSERFAAAGRHDDRCESLAIGARPYIASL